MASKRGLRRKACQRNGKPKKRYESKELADIDVRNLWKYKGERVHSYKCDFCGWWHIGHMPKRQRQAMNARRGLNNY